MSHKPEPDAEEFDAIEMRAADWMARREFGLSPAEQADLAAWVNEDVRHERALAEIETTSHLLDRWPETLPPRVVPQRAPAGATPRWRRLLPPAGMAAAAAILLVAGFWWRQGDTGSGRYQLEASTEIGGLRTISLPDGSSVQLNTDSDLHVRYSAAERRVELVRGEASFTVAKDPARPFFVEASGVSVRAVGTAFNVRLRSEAVEVLVMEGRVRVDQHASGGTLLTPPGISPDGTAPEPILSAGHQVIVPVKNALPLASAQAHVMAPAQIERVLAWQDRRLQFEAAPLSEVVAEFNRYSRHRLVIEDPTLAVQKFGGTFRPERYETLIGLLEQSFDVVAERGETATILRRRSPR